MRRVLAALEDAGAAVVVQDALCEKDSTLLAREAAGSGHYDAIVAAGGDGTICGVAAGLRGTTVPVGLLPLGTGNVMAHEIGLGRQPKTIADCLLDGVPVPVMGATANDTPFFLMAGTGLDAEAVAGLDIRLKRYVGKWAYVWPVIRAIFRPAPVITAQLDGQTYTARWVVVCNARSYAGGFTLSPDSSMFRPGLMAMLCTANSRLGLILDILMIGAGQAKRAPHVRLVPFSWGHLTADRPVPIQIDGESTGTLPVAITEDVRPVQVLVPGRVAAHAVAQAEFEAA